MADNSNRKIVTPETFLWTPKRVQQEIMAGQKQVTVIRMCRQIGKTDMSAQIGVTALIASPVKIPIGVASFSLKNARAVIWKRVLELLHPFPSYIRHVKSSDTIINDKTGSYMQLHGLSKEHGDDIRGHSYAGRHGAPGLLIIDEYQKCPYEIFVSAALPTLSAGDSGHQGWLFCIGTPSGSYDLMAMMETECDEAIAKGLDTHAKFHYSAETLCQPPYAKDHPHLTKEFLEQQKRRNPLVYAQEYLALLEAQAAGTVFSHELITHSITTDNITAQISGQNHGGLDFAVRKDKSILVVRNDLRFTEVVEIPYNGDPYAFVNRVQELAKRHNLSTLTIDRGGCGEVIADMLEDRLAGVWPVEDCRGVIAGSKAHDTSNFNLRSELVAMMRDYMTHCPNTISTALPFHNDFINELQSFTQKPNDRGTFQLDSRETIISKIGRSPDIASAAALSFYFQRADGGWSKPIEQMSGQEILDMPLQDLVDHYAGFEDSSDQQCGYNPLEFMNR